MRRVAALVVLVACHGSHHPRHRAPRTPTVVGDPTATAPTDPPPFPALRDATITPAIAIAPGPIHQLGKCTYEPRTAVDGTLVDRQLVIHCGLARALEMASGDGEVMVTQFSQQGGESAVRIGRGGELSLQPQPSSSGAVRFDRGAFQLGFPLPPGAPEPPPGWDIVDGDGTTIFATNFNRGFELMRGTLDRSGLAPAWKFAPAFAARVPAKGVLFWPVFLHHPTGEPTIVYLTDPHAQIDLTVRLPNGTSVVVPTWGTGSPNSSRVGKLSAIALPGEALPAIAAKVDASIVVAYPSGPRDYAMRAIVGVPQFAALPPTGAAIPTPSPTGPRCSEQIASRDRDEVFDPQLFAWRGANLAYLANRVHEELRWTVVPVAGKTPADDRAICDWFVDRRTSAKELVVMRLDLAHGTEVARIPVEYWPGDGFHGAGLLVSVEGDVLHAVATSYGVATYTRVALAR